MISFEQKGDFKKLSRYFERLREVTKLGVLDKYGREGVAALASATPVKTGKTAASWTYEIERQNGSVAIVFKNTNVNKGVPIAIILQNGHGTGTGGWVQGRDYINPAIQPIFDKIAEAAWKEVTNLLVQLLMNESSKCDSIIKTLSKTLRQVCQPWINLNRS